MRYLSTFQLQNSVFEENLGPVSGCSFSKTCVSSGSFDELQLQQKEFLFDEHELLRFMFKIDLIRNDLKHHSWDVGPWIVLYA